MKYGAWGTCILVHVLLRTSSMGHLFYLILQVKAIQIAVKIFKIHPQTTELWNMVPEARVFWSTCFWGLPAWDTFWSTCFWGLPAWDTYFILFCRSRQYKWPSRFLKFIHRQLSYEIWCLRHVYFGPRASEHLQYGTPILSYSAGQGNTNCRQDF